MRDKPLLLTLLPHLAGFDSCFPLIERLQSRGRVATETWLGGRLRQTEPRVVKACVASNVPYRAVSLLRLELGSRRAIRRADAVLTHSDPLAYGKSSRLRDRWMIDGPAPIVFVQHGMKQLGINYTRENKVFDFAAHLMLLWDDRGVAGQGTIYTPAAGGQVAYCGPIKVNRLAPHPLPPALVAQFAGFRQRVLICHNYGFEPLNYSDQAMHKSFAQWRQVFVARPDTLFVLRTHRGRRLAAMSPAITDLIAGLDNVILSERHEGLMKFASIYDILPYFDRVISHPSTVVWDALGLDRPVAIIDNTWPDLAELAQIATVEDFTAYLDCTAPLTRAAGLLGRLGRVDDNLDRAAAAIERLLGVGKVA